MNAWHNTSLFLAGYTEIHSCLHTRLNEVELGGGNVEGVNIGGQAGKGLLGAVGADQGVDLDAVNVVLLLEGGGDLALVGLDVDNEDEGVVLLNLRWSALPAAVRGAAYLLHRRLGVERVDEDGRRIHARSVGNRLAGVLGRARQLKGLGTARH